jgi:cytochrome d ubiquinol oxidase subunit II
MPEGEARGEGGWWMSVVDWSRLQFAAAAVVGFAVWTWATAGSWSLPLVLAVLAALAAAWQVGRGRDGVAFTTTAVTMAAVVVSIFVALYPRVMVSSLGAANDLTVTNTSSAPYTLKVMTVAAVILFPVVLVYQAWTYNVFRSRVGASGPSADADAGLAPRGP